MPSELIASVPEWGGDGNLPPGEYPCTWSEFVERFGWNEYRIQLLDRLLLALRNLKEASCPRVFIGGSLISRKDRPADFDACWDERGVNREMLDPLLVDSDELNNGRPQQKAKYAGEFFPSESLSRVGNRVLHYREFFQFGKDGQLRGTVIINLASEELTRLSVTDPCSAPTSI